MAREVEPREIWIARDVLRRMLRRRSQRQISLEIGKAQNYVARLIKGVIPLSLSSVVEILHVAGLAPGDYFRVVAEECSGADAESAARDLGEAAGAPASLSEIEAGGQGSARARSRR